MLRVCLESCLGYYVLAAERLVHPPGDHRYGRCHTNQGSLPQEAVSFPDAERDARLARSASAACRRRTCRLARVSKTARSECGHSGGTRYCRWPTRAGPSSSYRRRICCARCSSRSPTSRPTRSSTLTFPTACRSSSTRRPTRCDCCSKGKQFLPSSDSLASEPALNATAC